MNFENIHPYVRFARYLTVMPDSDYQSRIPLDARLFYCMDGHGEIETENSVHKMKKHSCLILAPGTEYRLKCEYGGVTYLAVNFDFDNRLHMPKTPVAPCLPNEFGRENILGNTNIKDIYEYFREFYAESINIENQLIKIEREYSRKYEFHETTEKNLLHNILIICTRKKSFDKKYENVLDIDNIIDYVHENFNKEISNKDIAKIFGFNANYISDMIKKHTGFSLRKYILHIRITKALAALESGRYNITEIARMCGFNDAGYFSRYFKKETGVSPTEYIS